MLKSYEAIYDHGKLKWLKDSPGEDKIRVIVTILGEVPSVTKRRQPPLELAGKGKITGDIVSPAVPPDEWEVLR